jgi:hypothetical protein
LADEYNEILNQDEYINVLYYSDHCGACGPWMVLKQLGYKNNKILMGGYDYVKPNIVDEYSPMTGNFTEEKAKYDYLKLINETSGSVSDKKTEKHQLPATTVIIKTDDAEEEEGGC